MATKLKLSLLFFALFSGLHSMAQSVTPAILQVSLTDQNNNPVPNYDVLIRPNARNLTDEFIVSTNSNGFWSDTVVFHEDASDPGNWFFAIFVLDSTSGSIFRRAISTSGPMQSTYWVSDTFKVQLTNPIKAEDNCGSYQVRVDSSMNDPMFIYFRNDLNRLKPGTTWVFGDGDTGHAPQSFHRYKVPGKYYFCHYTDSCGPVCDSVIVPMNGKGVGLSEHNQIPDFKLYPNPANNFLNISSSDAGAGIKEIQILDLSGNRLYRVEYNNALQAGIVKLDIDFLMRGMYIISIKSRQEAIRTFRLIKE